MSHYAIEPGRAIDLVREAGGVPVIAHPWGRSSYKVMTEDTIARLVDDHGLAGIEVDHQDHSAESRTALRAIADDLGIIYTGSSDHHGAGKIDHDLGVNTTEPGAVRAAARGRQGERGGRRGDGARGLPAVNSVINIGAAQPRSSSRCS